MGRVRILRAIRPAMSKNGDHARQTLHGMLTCDRFKRDSVMIQYFIRLMIVLLLASPVPAMAQITGENDGRDFGQGVDVGRGGGVAAGLSSVVTGRVTRFLTSSTRRCRKLAAVESFDCYRRAYQRTVNMLTDRPAYAEARAVLIEVEKTLDRIVTRYHDPRAKPSRKGYRPIKPAAVPRATAEFNKALDQAETKLLRSSGRGNIHYARIAEAVHSNKVLLRSQLDPGLADKLQFARAGRGGFGGYWAVNYLV